MSGWDIKTNEFLFETLFPDISKGVVESRSDSSSLLALETVKHMNNKQVNDTLSEK